MNEIEQKTFDEFWSVYPKKVGKGAAIKAWEKVMNSADVEPMAREIILAIQAQIAYRKEQKGLGEFVAPWKHPSTWLNNMCWEDEIKSHADLREKATLGKCDHCDSQVYGPSFPVCEYHLLHDKNGKMIGRMADVVRSYFLNHREIEGFTREQHIEFIKNGLKGFGK